MNSYCLYCRTGAEDKIVRVLHKRLTEELHEQAEILFPSRIMNQRKRGTWSRVKQPLLPGYVFIYLSEEIPFPTYLLREAGDAYKILKNLDNSLP